jgi:hypothetical protein
MMGHTEGQNVTYHVMQTFRRYDGEIVADEPREMPSATDAKLAIERLPESKVGAGILPVRKLCDWRFRRRGDHRPEWHDPDRR